MAPTRDRLPGSNISPSTHHAMGAGTKSSPRLQAQRSSMRRALHQSLGSLVGAGNTGAAPGSSKDNNVLGHSSPISTTTSQLEPQALMQGNGTVVFGKEKLSESQVNLSCSSSFANAAVYKLTPQRSSLRRAIRESVNETNIGSEGLVQLIDNAQPNVSRTSQPGAVPAAPKRVNRRQGVCSGPQRSSLRRAIRESQQVGIRSTHRNNIAKQDSVGEDVTFSLDKSTNSRCAYSLSGKADNPILLKTPPPKLDPDDPLTSLPASWVGQLSRNISPPSTPISPVSDISLSTMTSFHPEATIKARKATHARPRTAKAPSTERLPRGFTPATDLKSAPEPNCGSALPNDVQRDIPTLTAAEKNPPRSAKCQDSRLDSETQTGRRGWHKVHQIVNDAPSGLYLVEWEGRDPRTGVMVSSIHYEIL